MNTIYIRTNYPVECSTILTVTVPLDYSWHKGTATYLPLEVSQQIMKEQGQSGHFTGWSQCSKFLSVFWHCWFRWQKRQTAWKNMQQLEALGQCTPLSRHVLPVLRSRSGSISVSVSPPKFNHLFISPFPIFPENFMQIRLEVFAQSYWQTDKQTNKQTNK